MTKRKFVDRHDGSLGENNRIQIILDVSGQAKRYRKLSDLRGFGSFDLLVFVFFDFFLTRLRFAENSGGLFRLSKSVHRNGNCSWSQVQLWSTSISFYKGWNNGNNFIWIRIDYLPSRDSEDMLSLVRRSVS